MRDGDLMREVLTLRDHVTVLESRLAEQADALTEILGHLTEIRSGGKELDPLMSAAQVGEFVGKRRQWAYEAVERGDLPPPDVRTSGHRGGRWRRSTIVKSLGGVR